MSPLRIFIINLPFLVAVSAGTHSLWYYVTLTSDGTESKVFYNVGKVDDITIEAFRSEYDCPQYWKLSSDTQDFVNYRKYLTLDAKKNMNNHIRRIMPHFNHTGFHTLQRLAGCELDDDGTGRVGVWEAYDGQQYLDTAEGAGSWNLPTNQSKIEKFSTDLMSAITVTLYGQECLQFLKMYVTEGKNILNRRQKPKTRVLFKDSDTGKKVTCLATGFYPRHINMTLLRDGQPVPPEELEGGDVLPNGDDTYQQRKSVTVSPEEERRNYTCVVEHVSLDNKMDIIWGNNIDDI
ncbi:major histocompatibility complex class I-related gene protein-like isoform X2 [Brienomyrus brachyistius]|uniref:major histocompatibility complex class I-related gene protein-like isoform X2 n=1 Tax=Brienomyrus brachyistius TaxID=42636 RepID=UPI0020B31DF4|nr:major histocompatibility complex class I-related gene protein-like isoform X2 [Brienomyrus brachyistius]